MKPGIALKNLVYVCETGYSFEKLGHAYEKPGMRMRKWGMPMRNSFQNTLI
jgi:hypothetical protein